VRRFNVHVWYTLYTCVRVRLFCVRVWYALRVSAHQCLGTCACVWAYVCVCVCVCVCIWSLSSLPLLNHPLFCSLTIFSLSLSLSFSISLSFSLPLSRWMLVYIMMSCLVVGLLVDPILFAIQDCSTDCVTCRYIFCSWVMWHDVCECDMRRVTWCLWV